MTIEKKRTVTVQNDITAYFIPEEISALRRARDILVSIADENIYPTEEAPGYTCNWWSAADVIEEILEEADRNGGKILLYSAENGES